MRLIELKSILKRITNENKQVEVFHEKIYNGAAYKIENLPDYIKLLEIISEFPFSEIKKEEFENIQFFKNIPEDNILIENDFNTLVSFTNRLNGTMPIFYSTIQVLSKDQDPYILNIKIPEKYKKISEISEFNLKLINVFKKFDYGNDENNFILYGVDKGSEWYEILLKPELFDQIVFALDTASRFLGWWEVLKLSKDFILGKETFLEANSDISGIEYENKMKDKWMRNHIQDNLLKIENKNGRTDEEIVSKIMLGTKDLINLMDDGAELRISYNPPEYIFQNKNFFEINYKSLKINKPEEVEDKKTKKLIDNKTDNI